MTARIALAARFAALAGLAIGVAASPFVPAEPAALVIAVIALVALCVTRPRAARGLAACAWLALIVAATATAGLAIGTARLHAIDAGALGLTPGTRATVGGFVAAVPRRADGEVQVRVETPQGRLLVEAPEPIPDLDIGAAIEATGTVREPAPFERSYLARLGVRRVLAATALERRPQRRGGLTGLLDAVRVRAQDALSAGTPPSSAALLRGFVLGQDDRIDEGVREDFKRSGLAHLLAVSGQNVVLLAVLATAVLSVCGVAIRARLIAVVVLIAVYVLVTGAGPSIQRAGVMGVAGVAAALAGRPRSRVYALLLAAVATLALNPRATGDIGWQLSFAAVAGILLFCGPLTRALAGPRAGRGRGALAEGAALTISATLATAPLISFHFGVLSLVSLPANLVALAAEAPVMWLGMVAAAMGQLDWIPVEPVTRVAGLLAAYIAQVAAWFGRPSWAQVEAGIGGVPALAATYGALATAVLLVLRWSARRRGLGTARRRRAVPALVAGLLLAAAVLPLPGRPAQGREPGLVVSVLDVGQGDAILLDPIDGGPIMVDAGPAGADAARQLSARGTDRLAALLVTHPDADHADGAAAVLREVGADHLLFARPDPPTLAAATATGTPARRVAAGASVRSGDLRLRVLWPPRDLLGLPDAVGAANAAALVVLARWHGFRMLLTGDAEAELAPVHPGDVDLLKVAHHGSEDAGLDGLLAEASPELAVISVGAGNPYGHPSPATLAALEDAGARVARTDLDGEVRISVIGRAWTVATGPVDD